MNQCCQDIPKKMLKLLDNKDTILESIQKSRSPDNSDELYIRLNKTEKHIKKYKR